jgi:hypothetical protein
MRFLTMNADESADCAGSCESCFRTGLRFSFFVGPRNRSIDLKKLGFRLGPDLVILSSTPSTRCGSIVTLDYTHRSVSSLFLVWAKRPPPAMASPAMRRFTLRVVSKLVLALRQEAYERKKAASKLKKEQEKAAKATARNHSYVQKMLSLPKLIFTEQVWFVPRSTPVFKK